MSQAVSPQDSLVRSYLFLRRAIGVIGLALPFVLVLGKLAIEGGGLLNSISGYYYSEMRGVFVGSLCAIGVFLLSYRGYERVDNILANIAAVAAIGVALFPTSPPGGTGTRTDEIIGGFHLAFAAVFFAILAVFCLFLFRKTASSPPGLALTKPTDPAMTRRKAQRNRVYFGCGVVIVVCLVLIVVVSLFLGDRLDSAHPVLWLEAAATVAFGVAWLVKGEALLQD